MQRVRTVLGLAMAAVVILVGPGCGEQDEELLQTNREQARLLQERDAEIARLRERIRAIESGGGDAARLLERRDAEIARLTRQVEALQAALERSTGGQPPPPPPSSEGLPGDVEAEVRMLAAEYPDLFEFDSETGRLRLGADVTFDSGSNRVKPQARQAVEKLAAILTADVSKAVTVLVVGHTDSDPIRKQSTISLLRDLGKTSDNTGLSEARAEAVADVLVAGGVARSRIRTSGRGAEEPLVSNASASGKAVNRRVEIFLR